ncbi:MAG TPA: ribonuclease HII [Bacteroidales bacterium]|nr:ribonuclease HII [Bacteroidales bacterium]HPT00958.1 ribonuclease HII [Bacteroidales bacterium]
MLLRHYQDKLVEAGVDEAGRGCLAGPVYAAAVILPPGFVNERLNDSKKLTARQRDELRTIIEKEALSWSVAAADQNEIDRINILNASFLAMHRAIEALDHKPELLLIDGNRFRPYPEISHQCFVKGDATYMSIAAASVLAKTHRDEFMASIAGDYPEYGWEQNKGYPTAFHRDAIVRHGISPFHRKSFSFQQKLF